LPDLSRWTVAVLPHFCDDHPELFDIDFSIEEALMADAQRTYHLWCGVDIAANTFTATWTIDRTTYAPPITLH
jgi:hypothetical protein